ncbi:hypothetical protein TNCV_2708861 [Trichonephila clavipes]|nr:hypothetical protein TNCV_2708861 [Trichonephila clavipes]
MISNSRNTTGLATEISYLTPLFHGFGFSSYITRRDSLRIGCEGNTYVVQRFIHSDQRSGRPKTPRNAAVVEKVEKLIMKEHRLTVRKITDIQLRLIMRREAVNFLTMFLSEEQKELHLAVAHDLQDPINTEPGSLQLLAVSENENAVERVEFSE